MKSYDINDLRKLKKISNYDEFISEFSTVKTIKADTKILKYLKEAEIIAATGSHLIDKIANRETDIELLAYSDGKYIWDSRDIYYYENYGMPLNSDFVVEVM